MIISCKNCPKKFNVDDSFNTMKMVECYNVVLVITNGFLKKNRNKNFENQNRKLQKFINNQKLNQFQIKTEPKENEIKIF